MFPQDYNVSHVNVLAGFNMDSRMHGTVEGVVTRKWIMEGGKHREKVQNICLVRLEHSAHVLMWDSVILNIVMLLLGDGLVYTMYG